MTSYELQLLYADLGYVKARFAPGVKLTSNDIQMMIESMQKLVEHEIIKMQLIERRRFKTSFEVVLDEIGELQ